MGTQSAAPHWQINMARYSLAILSSLMMVAVVVGRPQAPADIGLSPLARFRDDITLLNLSDAELQEFLGDQEAITEFSLCFTKGITNCRSTPGANRFIKQIGSLGAGGQCKKCNTKQQARVEEVLFTFIAGFREKYPVLFLQTLPHITRFII